MKLFVSSNVEKATENFPVAVIKGMNHAQWGNGYKTLLIGQRDLKAEITLDEALATASGLAGLLTNNSINLILSKAASNETSGGQLGL